MIGKARARCWCIGAFGLRANATHGAPRCLHKARDYQDGGPIMKKLAILGIIGGAAMLTAAPVSLQWSQKSVALSLASAEAREGRPLTHPRAHRRAYRSAAYASAAGY